LTVLSQTANSKLIGKLGNYLRMVGECPRIIAPLHRTGEYLPVAHGDDGDEEFTPSIMHSIRSELATSAALSISVEADPSTSWSPQRGCQIFTHNARDVP
jgi:hypothetical protein